MKLRVKDRKSLETVLANLRRGREYLMKDTTLVCIRKSVATTTLDFTNQVGECCVSVNKEIGSELAMLHTGINLLEKLLSQKDDHNGESH